MLVTIGLEEIRILTIIGALEEEREKKQTLLVDITLSYNAKEAIEKDDVQKVIDYRFLEKACFEVADRHFFLLETFASALLEKLTILPQVSYAKVKVTKKAFGINAKSSFALAEKTK